MEPDALRALAAPRPVRSRDLHPFNGFYGHDAVLKRYAGRSVGTAAKLGIEHGLDLTGVVPDADRVLVPPVLLCLSEPRAGELAAALPRTDVIPIGPLIRYAAALAPAAPAGAGRRLVLVPAHSSDTVRAEFDTGAFLDAVAEYRAAFDDTVACLYWRDVLLGRDGAFRRRGIECATAGHLNDPAFLFRLLDILRDAAAVVTNEPGTHVAYAAALGLPVWIVPQAVGYVPRQDAAPDQLEALLRLRRPDGPADELRGAFGAPRAALSPEQIALLDRIAGLSLFRPPEQIAELFDRAEARFRAEVPAARRTTLRARAFARRVRSRILS